MPALSDAHGDPGHSQIGIVQSQEDQVNLIAGCLPRGDPKVISKAKLAPLAACRRISVSMIRPARIAAAAGSKGESPAAIKSALTNSGQLASLGRNSLANVDLPAPFGPATTITRF